MRPESEWYNEKLAARCIKVLERNNIKCHYARDCDEARAKLLELIPGGITIGAGGSLTLVQVGIMAELEKRGTHTIHNPYRRDGNEYYPPLETVLQEIAEVGKQALTADVFLTGINAITMDGKLIATDGFGNRVAALIWGPEKVYVVSGVNKIVANVDEALRRVKAVAAPMNASRLEKQHGYPPTPCGTTGVCVDCKDIRHCTYTVIVECQTFPQRIEVVLVGESLGY
jgi:L-lactate utilization protein LutB